MKNTKFIIQAAIIGAIYAVLTIVFAPISYGEIQVRISEALTILPYFTSAAIPGLFIGCVIANMLGPGGFIDIVFGSLATLLAAYISYKLPKKLVPLPPVLVNGIVIGFILKYAYGVPLPVYMLMLYVVIGQTIACYGLGYPLILTLEKYKDKIFR